MSNWNQANPRFRRPRHLGREQSGSLTVGLKAFFGRFGRGDKFKGAVFILIVLIIAGAVWALKPHFAGFVAPETPSVPEVKAPPSPSIQGPMLPALPALPEGSWSLYADQKAKEDVTFVVVEIGGTVSQSLESVGLSRNYSQKLINLLEQEKLLPVIQPGASFKAVWRDPARAETDLLRIEFAAAEGQRPLIFRPGGEEGFFRYTLAARPLTIHQATQAEVEDTFWSAGERAGLEPRVIMNLTDLLASQIDFVSDIRSGDSFQLLFRGQYQEGLLVAAPDILMIRMTNGDEKYEFYRHENAQGLVGFYDTAFRSIHKTFFKSPLQFTRISSGFTQNRFHPILKIVRPHLGVDYAAPAGTPVSTVADGQVEFAGRRGGYGLLVVIRHGQTYQTMYGHLSRIAKGIQTGAEVKQGDLIGYVGSTGLATGPHLDFRLRRNNAFVDPIPEMAKQEGQALPAEERAGFSEEVTAAQSRLKELLSWDSSL
ncbi:MAG: M23 family metallopeptidase [Deltaproteobacteria bacterium]|jgi:murein DD-endopeptidase MepM/ murein hydrolase activator NlpD|nr:M23 family metallopeptidase [Deltaproteobacteria bacterium]